jgi:hypothetical protein
MTASYNYFGYDNDLAFISFFDIFINGDIIIRYREILVSDIIIS